MANGAMLYEDYIKLRNANKGDIVIFSDGSSIEKGYGGGNLGKKTGHVRKHPNLDQYDGTYIG